MRIGFLISSPSTESLRSSGMSSNISELEGILSALASPQSLIFSAWMASLSASVPSRMPSAIFLQILSIIYVRPAAGCVPVLFLWGLIGQIKV